jgi:multidrug transporter EmrE-like cation transporter
VLHLAKPITIFPSSSGDKTFDYVQLLVFLTIATLTTCVWTFLDRDRTAYPRLARWLRTYVRYSLAFAMLGYGAFKVIKTQFPDVRPSTLLEPFGQFSPMGVIWSWMAASYAYNVFAGLAEMGSGFLLFFRRTTTLGALCCIAVMSNVVMINFAYDVPVKLYSAHLLLMAVFLLAPDLRRVVDAFVLNRGVPPADLGVSSPIRTRRVGHRVLKAGMIALGVIAPLRESWNASKIYGSSAPRPPLYGIWEVDSFVRGHEAIPPLLGDSTRWRRFTVDFPSFLKIGFLNDSTRGFRAVVDTTKHTLLLTARDSTESSFRYAPSGSGKEQLHLDVVMRGDSLHITLHHVDESKFLLLSRGYHWINELPFNR